MSLRVIKIRTLVWVQYAKFLLQVGNYKKTSTQIPVMHLNNIVELDRERMVVRVEPMVTMGQVFNFGVV